MTKLPAERLGAAGVPVTVRYVTRVPPSTRTQNRWIVLSPAVRLRAAFVTNTSESSPPVGHAKFTKSTYDSVWPEYAAARSMMRIFW